MHAHRLLSFVTPDVLDIAATEQLSSMLDQVRSALCCCRHIGAAGAEHPQPAEQPHSQLHHHRHGSARLPTHALFHTAGRH